MKLSTKTYQKCRKPAFLFDRRAIASVLWAWPRGKSRRAIIISSPAPPSQCLYPSLRFVWVDVILVDMVWPATSQERNSGGRAVFDDIVAVENEPCVGQHVKIGCLYCWIAETNVRVASVIDKHKNNVWFLSLCCHTNKEEKGKQHTNTSLIVHHDLL